MEQQETELLKPAAHDALRMWPVSKRVNKSTTQGDDPTLIEKIALGVVPGAAT